MLIMSEKQTEDHTLNELLNNMPQFTDKRSKEEVYQQIKSEIEMQEKSENRKRIQVSLNKWMPFIISIASILILTVLVSAYINDDGNSTADKASEPSSANESMRTMEVIEETSMDGEEEKSSDMSIMSEKVAAASQLVPFDGPYI